MTALKSALRRILQAGVSPRCLMAGVTAMRTLTSLPKATKTAPTTIRSIFFSFPYHSVGDLILSLSLLDRIHSLWPEADIDVVTGARMGPLVEAIPYVRRTFQLQRSGVRQSLLVAYAEIYNATKLFRHQIAGRSYDLAIAPRWDSADSFFSAYLAYLTGAPIRCGYSGAADGGSCTIDQFSTKIANGGEHEHETLRYTRLLSRCGLEPASDIDPDIPQHPIRALKLIQRNRELLGQTTPPPVKTRYVVLSPGATNPRRMWPIARFAEVGRAAFERFGLTSVVIGGDSDIGICQELSDAIGTNACSMAGKTDSLQMLDLIAGAELFLGNDSGPAHIAGGLGVSTLVISPFPLSCIVDHPNSPRRFRPAGPKVQVLQPIAPKAPCLPMCQQDAPHCILQVTIEDALAAVCGALNSAAPATG